MFERKKSAGKIYFLPIDRSIRRRSGAPDL